MSSPTKYTHKLADKRILIIGGTRGIGLEIASLALSQGATVILSSSSAANVSSAIASLQSLYPDSASQITGHACDLSSPSAVESDLHALFTPTPPPFRYTPPPGAPSLLSNSSLIFRLRPSSASFCAFRRNFASRD